MSVSFSHISAMDHEKLMQQRLHLQSELWVLQKAAHAMVGLSLACCLATIILAVLYCC